MKVSEPARRRTSSARTITLADALHSVPSAAGVAAPSASGSAVTRCLPADGEAAHRAAAMAAHPTNATRPPVHGSLASPQLATPVEVAAEPILREDGSLVTEYGLLAVVAATVAGVVIQWASGGPEASDR